MKKIKIDRLDMVSFLNGLVFYAPVALLVRTNVGVTMAQFFVLQAILSLTVFLFEIPAGVLTDRIGYKNTIILSQIILFVAKVLLFAAYIRGSYVLFVAEAAMEGAAACFLSGTQDAYIYSVYKGERYAVKMAHVANFGTAGFIVSTMLYAVFYYFGGIRTLIGATVIACGLGIPCVVGIRREPEAEKTKAAKSNCTEVVSAFAAVQMIFMVFLAAVFSLGFLLINFFYVNKLQMCGLREELLSVIIIASSVVQMFSEKILDHVRCEKYRSVMLLSVVLSGLIMMVFAVSQTSGTVIVLMVILPLFLSIPAYILDNIENTYIDQCGLMNQRATILSVANMAGNLLEIVILFASAYIVSIGISACFISTGVMLIVLGAGVYWKSSFFQDEAMR